MGDMWNGGSPEIDVLIDLLDYVKSRWAPGHVPRVGLGLRVSPELKRDYAISFARSVDTVIARGTGPLHHSASSQTGPRSTSSSQSMMRPGAPSCPRQRSPQRAAFTSAVGCMTERERPQLGGGYSTNMAESQGEGGGGAAIRFFDDPEWEPVKCCVHWSAKVGITVVNADAPLHGRLRDVLVVSLVAEEGSGAIAGVQEGDCVVEVEGQDVSTLACRDLLNHLREVLRVKKLTDASLTLNFLFARNARYARSFKSGKSSSEQEVGEGEVSNSTAQAAGGDGMREPSSSLGRTFDLHVDVACVGRLNEWCHLVRSESAGGLYYVVSEVSDRRMLVTSGVKKGDILVSVDDTDLTGEAERVVDLGRYSGPVHLSFWRPTHDVIQEGAAGGDAEGRQAGSAFYNAGDREGVEEEEEEEEEREAGGAARGGGEGRSAADSDDDGISMDSGEGRVTIPQRASPMACSDEQSGKGSTAEEGSGDAGSEEEEEEEEDRGEDVVCIKKQKVDEGMVVYSVVDKHRPEGRTSGGESSSCKGQSAADGKDWRGGDNGNEVQQKAQQQQQLQHTDVSSYKPGDVAWCRLGKLPRWPARIEETNPAADPPNAKVRFFGDCLVETVGLQGVEPFEGSFKKLYRHRYEKVYVRSVAAAVQYVMKKEGLDYQDFSSRVGLRPENIEKYMEEEALPVVEESAEGGGSRQGAGAARGISRRGSGSSGGGGATGSGTNRTPRLKKVGGGTKVDDGKPRWMVIDYTIDAELFRETKKNGIQREVWF